MLQVIVINMKTKLVEGREKVGIKRLEGLVQYLGILDTWN